jgi:hypothetical protein
MESPTLLGLLKYLGVSNEMVRQSSPQQLRYIATHEVGHLYYAHINSKDRWIAHDYEVGDHE